MSAYWTSRLLQPNKTTIRSYDLALITEGYDRERCYLYQFIGSCISSDPHTDEPKYVIKLGPVIASTYFEAITFMNPQKFKSK